jgi:hypothetical protein
LTGDVVDSFGIAGDSADAEALVIDLVPFALATDSVDWVVSSDAAALSIGKDLIDSAANHTEASLVAISGRTSAGSRFSIKSGVSGALSADAIDDEV